MILINVILNSNRGQLIINNILHFQLQKKAGCIVASICIDCNMSCKVVNSYFYLLHLSLYLTFQDLFVGLSWVPGLAYISVGMNNSDVRIVTQ